MVDSSEFAHLIGRRLKKLRMLRGMTQQDVGSALGLSFQQLQKYEHGISRISFYHIWRLSQLLEQPLSAWIDDLPVFDNLPDERLALGLLQAFRQIPDTNRKTLLCMLARELAELPVLPAPLT